MKLIGTNNLAIYRIQVQVSRTVGILFLPLTDIASVHEKAIDLANAT